MTDKQKMSEVWIKMKYLIEKIKILPRGVKASISFFLANVITKGVAYLTTPIYTRMLSTTEYGQVTVFLTWVQVFGIIAMFCLSYGVFNNGMVDYPNKRDEYSFSMLGLSNIITIIFSIILFIIYPYIQRIVNLEVPYIILMCVLFLFQPAYSFWTARQRYELKYKAMTFWSILCAIISPIIAICCIYFSKTGDRFAARVFGAELPLIVIYFGFYIWLAIKSKFRVDTSYWKSAFFFNLPLIPHYLSTHLLGSLDRIMIANIVGNAQTAYYSVAASIMALAMIIWQAINGSLIPYTYEKCKTRDYKAIDKITTPILIIFSGALVFIILFAPEVVRIMATEEYMDAVYVIPPIIASVFFQVLYHVFANVVYYYKKPIYVMLGSVVATILNFILNFVFINKYGYYAAGYTTLVCFIIQAFIDYWALRKVTRAKVYNEKLLLVLSGGLVSFALLCNLFYELTLIRYIIIGLILVVSFINKNRIVEIIRRAKG